MTRTVITAKAGTLLPALVDDIVRYGVSGIPIVDAESRLLGIVTEADLMSKVAFGGSQRRSIALLGDFLRGREQHRDPSQRSIGRRDHDHGSKPRSRTRACGQRHDG